jgi:hypothetical protein
MDIEKQLHVLSKASYPGNIDVVEGVMAQVRQHPYMIHRFNPWKRIALTAAAAVAAVVVVTLATPRSYDEEGISHMIASVSSYDYYQSVESAAENPIGYLYDD